MCRVATAETRTLTNPYNQRPQWLADARRDLDRAVAAAYGWPSDISEEDALAKLLELNLSRANDGDAVSVADDEWRKPDHCRFLFLDGSYKPVLSALSLVLNWVRAFGQQI